jgi:hypothetical protein
MFRYTFKLGESFITNNTRVEFIMRLNAGGLTYDCVGYTRIENYKNLTIDEREDFILTSKFAMATIITSESLNTLDAIFPENVPPPNPLKKGTITPESDERRIRKVIYSGQSGNDMFIKLLFSITVPNVPDAETPNSPN